jgi:hypothetical protein
MSSIQHGFDLLIALAVIASVNLWVICATCYLSYSQFLLCVKWQARAEIDDILERDLSDHTLLSIVCQHLQW